MNTLLHVAQTALESTPQTTVRVADIQQAQQLATQAEQQGYQTELTGTVSQPAVQITKQK